MRDLFTFTTEEQRQEFKVAMLKAGRTCIECSEVVSTLNGTFTLLQLELGKREGEGQIAREIKHLKGKR